MRPMPSDPGERGVATGWQVGRAVARAFALTLVRAAADALFAQLRRLGCGLRDPRRAAR